MTTISTPAPTTWSIDANLLQTTFSVGGFANATLAPGPWEYDGPYSDDDEDEFYRGTLHLADDDVVKEAEEIMCSYYFYDEQGNATRIRFPESETEAQLKEIAKSYLIPKTPPPESAESSQSSDRPSSPLLKQPPVHPQTQRLMMDMERTLNRRNEQIENLRMQVLDLQRRTAHWERRADQWKYLATYGPSTSSAAPVLKAPIPIGPLPPHSILHALPLSTYQQGIPIYPPPATAPTQSLTSPVPAPVSVSAAHAAAHGSPSRTTTLKRSSSEMREGEEEEKSEDDRAKRARRSPESRSPTLAGSPSPPVLPADSEASLLFQPISRRVPDVSPATPSSGSRPKPHVLIPGTAPTPTPTHASSPDAPPHAERDAESVEP